MNAWRNLLLNLSLIPRTYARVRNPGLLLEDYIGWLRSDYVVELRDGTKIKLRYGTVDKGIVKEVFLLDHYRFALEHMRPGGVVLDVGAQIGVFSIYAARRGPAGVQVHSFEPMSANHALLRENLARNDLLSRVMPHNCAVAGRPGRQKLFLSADNTGMHSLYGNGSRYEEVEVRAFNGLYDSLNIGRCDVLKLDCEGAEHEILMEESEELLHRTGALVMEYHDPGRLPEMERRLKDAGFTVCIPRGSAPMLHAWRER